MQQEIVPIQVDEFGTQFCDAYELYVALEVKSRFNDWIARRIADYGFVGNEDYFIDHQRRVTKDPDEGEDFDYSNLSNQRPGRGGDRRSVNYHLTLDMAKELAMVENNDKGRQVRRYFIQVEKLLRAQSAALAEERRVLESRELHARIDRLELVTADYSTRGEVARYTLMGLFAEKHRAKVKGKRFNSLELISGDVCGYSLDLLFHGWQPYARVDHAAAILGLSVPQVKKLAQDGDMLTYDGAKYINVGRLPEPVLPR